MKTWLSFARIKQEVTMRSVLELIGWNPVGRRGDRARGRCPIHQGQREDTFHVDLARNIFHCFACHAHGDVIDLTAALQNCSIRQAAGLLRQWFALDAGHTAWKRNECAAFSIQPVRKKTSSHPLRFALHPIDGEHPYLEARGIDRNTAEQFSAGYYGGPGLMQGRVVIPIHDACGQLLAYAGRSIDGTLPKYKLPTGFSKSEALFNLHRAAAIDSNQVVVVEGFFGCMRVHRAGQPCVVALMGCSLSTTQRQMLCRRFPSVTLMLDPDDAGQHASQVIASQLRPHCQVQLVNPAINPDEMSQPQLRSTLAGMKSLLPALSDGDDPEY